jgi:hypothetical protein
MFYRLEPVLSVGIGILQAYNNNLVCIDGSMGIFPPINTSRLWVAKFGWF